MGSIVTGVDSLLLSSLHLVVGILDSSISNDVAAARSAVMTDPRVAVYRTRFGESFDSPLLAQRL